MKMSQWGTDRADNTRVNSAACAVVNEAKWLLEGYTVGSLRACTIIFQVVLYNTCSVWEHVLIFLSVEGLDRSN